MTQSKSIPSKKLRRLLDAPQDKMIQAALAGDQRAFEELFRRYHRYVIRLCINHLNGDRDHALDLCQEAFICAFARLERLRDHSRFMPWLAQIARNKCLSFIRGQRIASKALREFVAMGPATFSHRSWVAGSDLIEATIGAMENPDLRETAHLFYLEGKRTAEIARLQNISQTAVTTRLNRFRTAIKRRMAGEASFVLCWMPSAPGAFRPQMVQPYLNRLEQLILSLFDFMPAPPTGRRAQLLLSLLDQWASVYSVVMTMILNMLYIEYSGLISALISIDF
ncbi:MAG TPA: RNA polymerase sigma factor [Nitrospiria bacterium]|nr:RNA polymerase sigma factor [Nitrospiria bacterium]